MSNFLTKKQGANDLLPIRSLQNQVENLFNNFFDDSDEKFPAKNWGLSNISKNFQPKVNISETEKSYNIEAALNGLKKEDVKIECKDNILAISANKEEEKKEENTNYHRVEYYSGSFYRSFQLPNNVDQNNIDAEMNDGILKITLPKTEKTTSKSTKINIK